MVKQVQTPEAARKSMDRSTGANRDGTRQPGAKNGPERDEIYGVVSVIYHALQGAQTYEQYIADARSAGDGELERFFETCCAEEIERARRGKSILLERLEEADDLESEGDEEEDDEEDEETAGDGSAEEDDR